MDTPQRSDTVGGRLDLALLCNDRGYKVAVEVGTDRGVFARDFLDRWTGEMLYCVDSYASYTDMEWSREADREIACIALAPHARRCRLMLCSSLNAMRALCGMGVRPGFVYIDAAHDYESVQQDLLNWYALLLPGGVLAGDDFLIPTVQRATVEFATLMNLSLYLTTDYNRSPSWFLNKP